MIHNMAGAHQQWDGHLSQEVIPPHSHDLGEKVVSQGEGSCVLVCGRVLEGPRVRAVHVCRLEVKSDVTPRSQTPWDF